MEEVRLQLGIDHLFWTCDSMHVVYDHVNVC